MQYVHVYVKTLYYTLRKLFCILFSVTLLCEYECVSCFCLHICAYRGVSLIFFPPGPCPKQKSTFSKALTQATRVSFVCYQPTADYGKATVDFSIIHFNKYKLVV